MIIIYTSNWCSYCNAAKNLLDDLKLEYEEINIEKENISREELFNISGGYTIPQISINKKFIGGYNELQSLYQNNQLLNLLNDR